MKSGIFRVTALLLLAVLASCGGGSSKPASTTSGIANRVLVSNAFATPTLSSLSQGVLEIIDGSKDLLSAFTISTGLGAGLMALSPDKHTTLAFSPTSDTLFVADNDTETLVGMLTLPDFTEYLAILPDNKTVLAPVRNAGVSNAAIAGAVQVIDISDRTKPAISTSIAVPEVRRLVLSHNGSKALAFSDCSPDLPASICDPNAVAVIDTSAKTATFVTSPSFDHPTWAVFNSDDSKAYILSCGPECGGTQASVTVLDMTSNTPGASANVSAATIGLLNNQNLYVAGTSASGGTLDVVNTGSLTVSGSAVAISDGFHDRIDLGSNNKLFIGAHACTAQNCLSIFDTNAQTAVVSPCATFNGIQTCATGNVTGLQPIANRNVVYVIAGGELVIIDTGTSAPQQSQIDIVGQAVDVKAINQ